MKYITDRMARMGYTRASLSRRSRIPESTLRDILDGKAQLDHCEGITLMCLAEALDTKVEDLLNSYWDEIDQKAALEYDDEEQEDDCDLCPDCRQLSDRSQSSGCDGCRVGCDCPELRRIYYILGMIIETLDIMTEIA